ncbi:GMC oxidoreductase [Cenococcum geophilum]
MACILARAVYVLLLSGVCSSQAKWFTDLLSSSRLTVANLLTENGKGNVLVVEFRFVDDHQGLLIHERVLRGNARDVAVVGRSSAVDGMFLDRGSASDYDAWEQLGNPGWGWSSLLPYFKKVSVTSTPPLASLFREKEGANGKAFGVFWVPSPLDLMTETRSYARTAHYYRAKSRSNNYHLFTGYTVIHITFTGGLTANKEVILAAGVIGAPQILQRSGIGPKALLEKAGIKVKQGLPGVGRNFQDHPIIFLVNATFNSDAFTEYQKFKTSPYTMSQTNAIGFLSLKTVNPNYVSIISTLESQDATSYLPKIYDQTLIASSLSQRSIVASQGTVSINITDPFGDPTTDYGAFANLVEVANSIAMIKLLRKYYATPSTQTLGPVETFPGANITSDADIENILRTALVYPSFTHPSCTCAMLPLDRGGVVSPDLRVYGTSLLSVIPLIPTRHLQASVYAIAEKICE